MKAILVTACPAGIATSFLAAKRIEQQAKLAGWELTLDVGSSVQPRQVPSKEQIAAAELVLVVASAPVDLAAYDGALLVVSHDPVFLEAIGITREIALG